MEKVLGEQHPGEYPSNILGRVLGPGCPAQNKLPASLWSPELPSCQMHLNESSGERATMDGPLLRENSNNAAIHLFV